MYRNSIFSILIITISIVMLTSSCDPFFNCLDGNGILKVEDRIVTEFYGVENRTDFDVTVLSADNFAVIVTADENLLEEIKTVVRSGNLIVDTENDRCLSSNNKIEVEVHMPEVDFIELAGSGDIEVKEFVTGKLEIRNSGSGDIQLSDIVSTSEVEINLSGSGDIDIWGKTQVGEYILSGSGDIYARDFKSVRCTAVSSGSGNISCYASQYLNANIGGSGNIYYYGNPDEVVRTDNGSGSIEERN